MKEMRCGDVMSGCAAVFHGQTVEDVLSQAEVHARAEHGIPEMTPQVEAVVRAAIRDVPG